MEFIDLQDSFYNLRAEHCERIKAIVNTHKSIAFFTDLVRTSEDVVSLLDYLEMGRNTVLYCGRGQGHQQRQEAITAFNVQTESAVKRGNPKLPRLMLSLQSASGFHLSSHCAIVIIYRTTGLGRYESLIRQASARHGLADDTSVYEIAYGENNNA